jgi:hypothetical protein
VWRHILIGIRPFFVNTVMSLPIGIAAIPMHIDFDHLAAASGVPLWLAISIAKHSLPSTGDGKSMEGSLV